MKRKRIVLLGVFITVISLVALLLPLNSLFADEWDKSSLEFIDQGGDCNGIFAVVKNGDDSEAMEGTTEWKLYWIASGNPKGGTVIASGNIPALLPGETYQINYDPADNPNGASGNYMFWASQRPGHPGTGVLWSEEIELEECNGSPCEPSGSINADTSVCEEVTIIVDIECCENAGVLAIGIKGVGIVYTSDPYNGPWPKSWTVGLEPGDYIASFHIGGDCDITLKTEEFTVVPCEEPGPETGAITVVKRDPGGNLLAGAGFTVYFQASGNPAAPEGFTDGSGMITFPGLPFDTYIVRETTAPAGFGLAPEQVVVLNADNAAVVVNFINEPITTTTTTTTTTVTPPPATVEVLGITEELPFTGQSMWLYIIGAAMLALAGGLTFVLRSVKSKA